MEPELKLTLRRSLLDNHYRELHVHPDFIRFEDKDLATNAYTTLKTTDIKDFRFGIRWYRYYFVFGREYQLYIRSYDHTVLKIHFNSYFGRKKKEKHELYQQLLNHIWDFYFKAKVKECISEYQAGESITIGDVNLNPEGIIITVSGLAKLEKKLIPWEDVKTRDYHTYFSIYSAQNPREINRGYHYKEDWNTEVLLHVVRNILAMREAS